MHIQVYWVFLCLLDDSPSIYVFDHAVKSALSANCSEGGDTFKSGMSDGANQRRQGEENMLRNRARSRKSEVVAQT